jgi:PAS domain S-box-containing protein
MMPLSRSARILVAIAGLSLLAMVLLYALAPGDRSTVAIVSDVSWTWAAIFAAFACFLAARRVTTSEQRGTWRWIGAGAISFLAGRLVWNFSDLVRGAPPPYPSAADIGFLGIYVCLIVGVMMLVRGQPTRRGDPELFLDATLVTFAVGAVAYEYLLEPLLTGGVPVAPAAFIASVGWSIGAVAVLWMILIQMLRRPAFPAATAGLLLPGVIAFAIGNQVYAIVALRGTYRPGGPLDLTWDAGLLLTAAAAAIAPDYAQHLQRGRGASPETSTAARFIALVLGLAAMTGMVIIALLQPQPEPDVAVLMGLGMVIVAARVLYSLGVSRRYAHILEDEVANQTRSLMSSLGATASAERNLRLLMEAVPDAITVVDRDGNVLDENAAGRALGTAAGGEQRSAFAWLEGTALRIARENLVAAFDGELRRFEVPFHRPDGSDGSCQLLFAPVRESGRIPKVLMLVRDITEQRRAQTQLQQAEKLAAMGQLVSGVAHEINNPAAIISGFAQTLLLDQLGPEQRETVQMMYDEATRIGRITSNLLAFARAGSKERTLVELNEIVRRTFALRSYHLTTLNITVNLDLDDANPNAWANGSEMQQMLLNLLINAEQALLTVTEKRAITIRTAVAGDEGVRLQVADTGPGIPREIQEKIFDPFFTTKPEGTGTGLGLSICYGIVHDHGGRITVHSVPGHGATFTIVLPRDARTHQRITPAPVAIPNEARTGRAGPADGKLAVLLIDDEEGVRRAVVNFLKRRGMHVIAVEDGGDALRVLRRERIDVIVSDVRMPGMSGGEFLERLKREHPSMVARLIFTTGDTFATDTSTLLRDSGVPSLVKPYDFSQLETVLHEVAAKTGT